MYKSDKLPRAARTRFSVSSTRLLLLLVVLIASARVLPAQSLQEPVEPVNIILDSDLAHSADDVGDHAMLWALSARGEVNVLALIVSSTNDYSAPAARAIATYYGHPNVLVGANKGTIPNNYNATFSAYTQQIAAQFGNPNETRANDLDAATAYRQALAGAPDHSVYIVNGGFYRPMYDLLHSGADAISPLTGPQLVAQKVRRAVLSAGDFPDSGPNPHNNLENDADSAAYVIANWPTEIVWFGYSDGWDVVTGPASNTDPNTNPIALGYGLACYFGQYCANNAPAWTQVAMLYAVRGGLNTNFLVGGQDGSTVVWDSTTADPGRSIWSQSPDRQHSYLLRALSASDAQAIINPLVRWIPPTNNASTTTTVRSSSNPSTYGQSVSFTATASSTAGTPTGTVTFFDGSTALGTGSLSAGVATLATSALSVTTHSITAVYGGTTNFQSSTSAVLLQVVNRATTSTTLTSSPNPSTFNQTVTLTATLTATNSAPAGTVTFLEGSNVLGSSSISGGTARLTIATLAVGSHSLTASYLGGSNWLGSTSATRTQTVNRASSTATLTSSVNPSLVGQSVTFTARVTGSGAGAIGTVQFRDGSTTLSTVALDSTGQATFTTSALSRGSHAMRAVYSGDTNFQSSTSSSLTQTVKAMTTTALVSSRNPSNGGQSVTFTATVSATSGTPSGTVTFRDGTTTIGSANLNSSRQASISTSSLSRGTHSITAVYGGATGFLSSTSAPLNQQVN